MSGGIRTDRVMKGVDRNARREVLDHYARGASTEQCAKSAGVDVAAAHQIIAEAIAEAQKGRE
ncbi:hypothetical protein IV417_13655 [Alphaproteobacteria bacterium KMM 3653]|uniref:Uncharacterized protein n=1 Tax=Harenicola maris TaxID=2841044 RepID=A0AAP2CRP1_9RHOB|nr:hypothetical protein [Harenicola maris]